jgi:hypothetical protein
MLEEYAEGRINLYKILSIPILQELVSYNDVDNFDRHSALLIAMIARDQMHKVQVKQHDDLVKKNFFGGNVFGDG